MKYISWNSVIHPLMTMIILAAVAVVAAVTLEAAEPATSTNDEGAAVAAPFESFAEEGENPDVDRQIRIAGSALKPRGSSPDYQTSGSGGCVYVTGGSANEVWNTPLWLPQGSAVHQFRMYFNDTSPSDSTSWFTVYDLYGGIVAEFSATTFGDTGEGYSTSNPIDHVVDYSTYSYVLNWRPAITGSTMQLCGFRVYYTTP